MARSSAAEFDRQAAEREPSEPDDIDLSNGGFNPIERPEQDRVPAHRDEPPQYGDDDPFAT